MNNLTLSLAALGAGLLAASGVLAPKAEAASQDTARRAIEEVVVTARRREETAQSVPIPITVMSADDLRSRGALNMRDLERMTPNLSLENSGVAKSTAQVFLRGIGQINWGPAQDPKVGIYLDGVYLARPQGGVFDLMDVERVEVLRGPQGTLFGRNTTAGLVHVITKRPGDQFEAQLQGLAGESGQLGAGLSLNVPIADSWAGRFSLQHRESDGYVENRFDGKDWMDENAQNARGSLLWTPSDQFEALLSIDYQRVRELSTLATCRFVGADDGSDAGGLDGLAVLGGFFPDVRDTCKADRPYKGYQRDPNPDSKIDAWGYSLTAEWDITERLSLTSITAYRDIEEVNGSWGLTGDSPAGDILSVQQRNSEPSEYTQFSQEFRLHGSAFDDRVAWIGGLYYFTEDGQANFDVPLFEGWVPPDCVANPLQLPCFPAPGGGVLGDFVLLLQTFNSNFQLYDATNESWAIFGEVTYDITDAWSVTAGIRYTEDDRELSLLQELLSGAPALGYVCPDGSAPLNRTCSRSGDFSETTPRIILNYQVNDDFMVYAGWSKGYSSGGFNQNPRLQDYEPEVSKNWELGFKSNLLEDRVKLNMSAFLNTYENQQLSVARIIDNQNVVAILNAQEATLYGIEAEALALLGNWTFTLAVGTTDGKYEKFEVLDTLLGPPPELEETTVRRDLTDNEIVLGSPYTASLAAGYQHQLSRGGSLDVNVGWSHRGRQYNDLDKLSTTRQDAYGLMDARLTWNLASQQTSVSLVGNNLLDEEYFSWATGAPGDVRNGYFWGPPRRVRLEFRHEFQP